ncbi:MAG: hypothetical protein JNL51_07090 [Chitinophagaceae bacterium]|nr:hypothetical protein [Chitinophagaceae bacterium]
MTKTISYSLLFLLLNSNSIFAQSTEHETYETEEYKISFPGPFEKSTQVLSSNLGQLLLKIISYEPKGGVKDSNYVYMIMETEYPDSTIHSDKKEILDEFFSASINGAVKNVNGKLIKETRGLTGIYPNRTIEVDYQNGLAVIRMRLILRKSRMIMIQTITNTQNYPNSSATSFVDSFGLK